VTGSFSRTAVNADSGAMSAFAGLTSSSIVGLTCIALTGALQFLPKIVLASIIFVAAIDLVEVEEAM